MVRGQRGWGCGRWREGCSFVVWFEWEGVEVPEAEAARVVARGESRLFVERDGLRWRLCFDARAPQGLRWASAEEGRKKPGARGAGKGAGKGAPKPARRKPAAPKGVGASRWARKGGEG